MQLRISTALVFAAALLLPTIAAQAQQVPQTYGAPITLDNAKRVIAAAQAEAKKNNFTMVITIIDSGGHAVAMERMDGTQYGSLRVAEGKAQGALDFRRSSKVLEDTIATGGVGLRFLSIPGVVTIEGGELLIAGDKIVGAIGVSGGTSAQDGQVARVGVAALGK